MAEVGIERLTTSNHEKYRAKRDQADRAVMDQEVNSVEGIERGKHGRVVVAANQAAFGKPHHYRLLSEGREPRVLRTKEVGIELRPGDCLEIRSSGGGGWGPPEKRSAEARQRDREQGMIDVAAEQASS